MHRFRRIAVLASLVLAVALVVPAGATADPGPSLSGGGLTLRGAPFSVTGRGLEPGSSYTLTTDGGTFQTSGTATLVATADDDGQVWANIVGTGSVSPAVSSIDLTLAATNDPSTPLASAVHGFAAPYADGTACPGVSSPLAVIGLAEGDYRLSALSGTFADEPVHVESSDLQTSMAAAPDLGATSAVTVTSVQEPTVSYVLSVRRAAPRLTGATQDQYSHWQLRYTADCFTPGESVVQVNHSTNSTGVRAVADKQGVAHITVDLHPAVQARVADPVIFGGKTSGQTTTVAGARVLGTTLYEGQSVSSTSTDPWGRGRLLVAPSPDTSAAGRPHSMLVGACNPGLATIFPDGSGGTDWQAFPGRDVPGTCRLTVERGGDLVLRNAAGRTTWTSRTHGTRSGNRLVVSTDHGAEMITGTQAIVWTTILGPVATPAGAQLHAPSVLHRAQTRGRGSVRFGLDRHGNVVVTRAGKVVWIRHTAGKGGVNLRMLDNGDVVLQTAHRHTVWSSGTRSAGAVLEVTPVGDVAIFTRQSHHLIWHTNTGL